MCEEHHDLVTPFICMAKNFILEANIFAYLTHSFYFSVPTDISEKFIRYECDAQGNHYKLEASYSGETILPIVPMSYFEHFTNRFPLSKFRFGTKAFLYPEFFFVFNDSYPTNTFPPSRESL